MKGNTIIQEVIVKVFKDASGVRERGGSSIGSYDRRLLYLLLFLLIQCFFPREIFAHGVNYRVAEKKHTVVVEAFYSDSEPMRYAEVHVFSPQNQKLEYQNGRTDKNGRFAFCPDTDGEWRMEVSDGMGHKVKASILTEQSKIGGSPSNSGLPVPGGNFPISARSSGIVMGLSLIMNLFMGWYLWKKRLLRHESLKGGGR